MNKNYTSVKRVLKTELIVVLRTKLHRHVSFVPCSLVVKKVFKVSVIRMIHIDIKYLSVCDINTII